MSPARMAANVPLTMCARNSALMPENQQHQTNDTTAKPCSVGYATLKASAFANCQSIVRLLMAFATGLFNQSGYSARMAVTRNKSENAAAFARHGRLGTARTD